jgi:hypothetical protein
MLSRGTPSGSMLPDLRQAEIMMIITYFKAEGNFGCDVPANIGASSL